MLTTPPGLLNTEGRPTLAADLGNRLIYCAHGIPAEADETLSASVVGDLPVFLRESLKRSLHQTLPRLAPHSDALTKAYPKNRPIRLSVIPRPTLPVSIPSDKVVEIVSAIRDETVSRPLKRKAAQRLAHHGISPIPPLPRFDGRYMEGANGDPMAEGVPVSTIHVGWISSDGVIQKSVVSPKNG